MRMNRPMVCLTDMTERQQRRVEYAAILKAVNWSEVFHQADPQPELEFLLAADPETWRHYPALILEWQLKEGILELPVAKKRRCIVEWRSEYAKRLAIYAIACQVGISEDSLRRRCAKPKVG